MQAPPAVFNSLRSPAATPAPPRSRSGHLLPTTLAVDAPRDCASPRAHSGLPATSENAPWIITSARAKIPGCRRQVRESPCRAGFEKQRGSPRKDPPAVSPGTVAPANRCPCGRPPLPPLPGCHAFCSTQPGFFFGKDGRPAAREVLRSAPFGRIAFSNTDLSGSPTIAPPSPSLTGLWANSWTGC